MNFTKLVFIFFVFYFEIQSYIELKLTPYKNYEMSLNKQFLLTLSNIFSVKSFIETGTARGGTTNQAKDIFTNVSTIETDANLYNYCLERFKNSNNVSVYLGSSVDVLPKILLKNKLKTLFWLDGHNSPGIKSSQINCPLLQELSIIKENTSKDSIILIDDIRCSFWQNNNWDYLINQFGTNIKNLYDDVGLDWPSFANIYNSILNINPNYKIIIFGDILMAFPKNNSIKLSKEFKAFMISLKSFINKKTSKKIIYSEKIISNIDYKGFCCIKEQVDNLTKWEHSCYHPHLNFWLGLILLKKRKFDQAKEQFILAKSGNLYNSRLDLYIKKCGKKSNQI